MEKKELKVESFVRNPNIIEIDGVKYILDRETLKKKDGIEHSDKIIFKRFDEELYEKNINLIVNALAKRTSRKELLTEVLKTVDFKSIKRLARRIESGKPIKKHKGCLGFKIGDAYVQLLE